MKKFLVVLTALALFVSSSMTALAADVSVSGDNLGRGAGFLGFTVVDNGDGTVTAQSAEVISFYLPETYVSGDTVTINIKGTCDSDFRVWLIDVNEVTNTDPYKMSDHGFTSGAFDETLTVTVQENAPEATEILFKGFAYGEKMVNLNVTSITVTAGAAEEPAAPAEETPDTTDNSSTAPTTSVPKTGVNNVAPLYVVLAAAAVAGLVASKKKTVTE